MLFGINKVLFLFVIATFIQTQQSVAQRFFRKCFFTDHQCPNNNITFHLYTREQQDKPTQLDMSRLKSITKAKFAKNRPLIVLIHGYTGHKDYSPNTQIRPAYFKKDEYNIISVDYKSLAPEPCYPFAVSNLPTVANCTAQLLDFLIDRNIFSLESIHVIGFSLGAQTAGMIANYLKDGRKLKRITGLDPAKPMFVRVGNDGRLDETDAGFVE